MEVSENLATDEENRIAFVIGKRKSNRRSSILKATQSPMKGALGDLNPNVLDYLQEEKRSKKSRRSSGRRVSFAEKNQVKEFCKDEEEWNTVWMKDNSSADQQTEKPQVVSTSEYRQPTATIKGLKSLLNGNIQCSGQQFKNQVLTNFEPNTEASMEFTICLGRANEDHEESSRQETNPQAVETSDYDRTTVFRDNPDGMESLDLTCRGQGFINQGSDQCPLENSFSLEKVNPMSFLQSLTSTTERDADGRQAGYSQAIPSPQQAPRYLYFQEQSQPQPTNSSVKQSLSTRFSAGQGCDEDDSTEKADAKGFLASLGKQNSSAEGYRAGSEVPRNATYGSGKTFLQCPLIPTKEDTGRPMEDTSPDEDDIDLTSCHGQGVLGTEKIHQKRRSINQPSDVELTQCYSGRIDTGIVSHCQATQNAVSTSENRILGNSVEGVRKNKRESIYTAEDLDLTGCMNMNQFVDFGSVENTKYTERCDDVPCEVTACHSSSILTGVIKHSRRSIYAVEDVDITVCNGKGLLVENGGTTEEQFDENIDITVCQGRGIVDGKVKYSRRSIYGPEDVDITICAGKGFLAESGGSKSFPVQDIQMITDVHSRQPVGKCDAVEDPMDMTACITASPKDTPEGELVASEDPMDMTACVGPAAIPVTLPASKSTHTVEQLPATVVHEYPVKILRAKSPVINTTGDDNVLEWQRIQSKTEDVEGMEMTISLGKLNLPALEVDSMAATIENKDWAMDMTKCQPAILKDSTLDYSSVIQKTALDVDASSLNNTTRENPITQSSPRDSRKRHNSLTSDLHTNANATDQVTDTRTKENSQIRKESSTGFKICGGAMNTSLASRKRHFGEPNEGVWLNRTAPIASSHKSQSKYLLSLPGLCKAMTLETQEDNGLHTTFGTISNVPIGKFCAQSAKKRKVLHLEDAPVHSEGKLLREDEEGEVQALSGIRNTGVMGEFSSNHEKEKNYSKESSKSAGVEKVESDLCEDKATTGSLARLDDEDDVISFRVSRASDQQVSHESDTHHDKLPNHHPRESTVDLSATDLLGTMPDASTMDGISTNDFIGIFDEPTLEMNLTDCSTIHDTLQSRVTNDVLQSGVTDDETVANYKESVASEPVGKVLSAGLDRPQNDSISCGNQELLLSRLRDQPRNLSTISEESDMDASKKGRRVPNNPDVPAARKSHMTVAELLSSTVGCLNFMPTSRRSTIAFLKRAEKPEEVSEFVRISCLVKPKAVHYGDMCSVIEQEVAQLKPAVEAQERELNASNAAVFCHAHTASKAELSGLESQLKELKVACTKRAKGNWAEKKAKMAKKLVLVLKEHHEMLTNDVDVIEETLTVAEDCFKLLNEIEQEGDIGIEVQRKTLSASEKENEELSVNEALLQRRILGLESREAELKELENQRSLMVGEKESLTKEKENFEREKLESEELLSRLQRTVTSNDNEEHLVQKYEWLKGLAEWDLDEWDEHHAKFIFLFNTLDLLVEFGAQLDVSEDPGERRIQNISLTSQLTDDSSRASRLAHSLALDAISSDCLLQMCPTTSSLPKVLDHLSGLMISARTLGDEVYGINFHHIVSVLGSSIFVEFSSLKAFVKFIVQFTFDISTYPDGLVINVTPKIGQCCSREVEDLLQAVLPGPKYLTRLVDAAQRFLEGKPSTSETT